MKTNLVGLSVVVLALLVGCAREHEKVKVANPRTMSFSKAGIALVLGDEWQGNDPAKLHSAQPPTLVSDAGVIRVILLPPDRTDPEVVADGLRTVFEEDSAARKHSFRRQRFVSDAGARGICVSYLQLAGTDGTVNEVQNRHYLVRNREGRCVVVNYVASAGADADGVNRTIRKSLALQ